MEILELEERRNCENDLKNDYGELGEFFMFSIFMIRPEAHYVLAVMLTILVGEKLVLKLKELESRKPGYRWNRGRDNRIGDCNSVEPFIPTEPPVSANLI